MATVHRSAAAVLLTAALSCALLIALSYAFVDRPLSTWSHAALHGMNGFIWLTHIVDPIPFLAIGGLAGTGLAAAFGWRPGRRGQVVIACSIAALVAMAIKDQLKFAFGRTWPETWINNNPSWITDGVFAFQFFHGGQGWASFPSGHTTLIAAPITVLWLALPAWRWLWAGLVAAVVVGLIGADYHWASDIIAGTFLGAACGAGVAALFIWIKLR
jgi:membrane-associated phospholipid phosphatase